MKVLLITAYFKEEKRSIPTSHTLAQALCRAGCKVVVLTSRHISRPTYDHHPNLKVYETRDLFIKDPLNLNLMPDLFKDLGMVLEKERPDVCIISKYIFFPILALPYLKAKKQKVIVVTDTYPGKVWFVRSRLVNFLAWSHYQSIGRFMLNLADLVVLTHGELVDATRNLGVKRYRVIRNGLDLEAFDKARPAKDIKKDKLNITFVGRLASIKGIDTLLEAAKAITKQDKDVRFLLAGEGQLASSNLGVRFLGHRKDVPSVLKSSDIFVMPSLSEGLPTAVLEAMAASLPVVASDIPGGMQVLIKDKRTGLLFKKGDAKDLERKLELLIRSPALRRRLGQNARRHIEKGFSQERMASEWMEALKEVAG